MKIETKSGKTISFVKGVKEFLQGAFANGPRIVEAELPERRRLYPYIYLQHCQYRLSPSLCRTRKQLKALKALDAAGKEMI